ncbi:MAG: TonB-dependent receptor [Bacteroidota bacterium]|nr:TonB-dependent receptor [Bacteroidota bacterium]
MRRKSSPILVAFPLFLFLVGCHAFGQSGGIRGTVTDAATGVPLPGANVLLRPLETGRERDSTETGGHGAAADADGRVFIDRLAPGSYALRVSFIGYETRVVGDAVVRPGRITMIDAALHPAAYTAGEVEVTAGYFTTLKAEDVSVAAFSGEEIRRSPGSAGDVSRIMMVLPSVAKVNDQSNSLIVRGGSPLENAFFVDGIEVPNINHFPAQGSSGGPLGLLPVDLIRDVTFSAGGFAARHGDRLSSIMDIRFREGDRERILGQADLNFSGFGGLLEGPLGTNGSWLLSARRSYLDLLVSAIDIGTSVAPRYGDAAAKVSFDLSSRHRLVFVGLWSDDHNNPDATTAAENDMQYYGRQDIYNYTGGFTWRALWNEQVFTTTSVSWTGMDFGEEFFKTGSGAPLLFNDSHERWVRLRSETRWSLASALHFEFGGDVKALRGRYDNRYGGVPDELGNPHPEFLFQQDVRGVVGGAHATAVVNPWSVLTVSAGLRAGYVEWNEACSLEPRVSVALQVNGRGSVRVSAGLYTQSLPLLLLARDESTRTLENPRAVHGVVSFSYLLGESTRLTIEGYLKQYDRFPVDPDQSALFLVDELQYRYGFFMPHGALRSTGTAVSRGVECTVQKKLAQGFYGIASASYSAARYTDGEGVERPRVYDNRLIFGIEGGWKPNASWEVSLRWLYAGGAPYTPLDVVASAAARQEVLDATRINGQRHPDYHALNLRVDHRCHFDRSALVVYLSVWNAYNRKNVAGYIWDERHQRVKTLFQWGLLPIFGIEWEF